MKNLKQLALGFTLGLSLFNPAFAEKLNIEKPELKLGFIKLTDMAPLAIAYEKGFFEDEGLYITLEPQANWKVLLDRVITGELDGAHMLAGQVLASGAGIGAKQKLITPFSLDLNGNGIQDATEVGISGVTVFLKNAAGTVVGTTTTVRNSLERMAAASAAGAAYVVDSVAELRELLLGAEDHA